jgi:hypothetical protein
VYPVLLNVIRGSVPPSVYVHFVASLALCGLIAAAYPFFGVSLLALRCFYPALVHWDTMSKDELPSLRQLGRHSWFHLILAASVPMLSVLILALSGLDRRLALLQQDLQVLIKLIERSSR